MFLVIKTLLLRAIICLYNFIVSNNIKSAQHTLCLRRVRLIVFLDKERHWMNRKLTVVYDCNGHVYDDAYDAHDVHVNHADNVGDVVLPAVVAS